MDARAGSIFSRNIHSEIPQWIDRRTEPAHSAREDMSIVAVDAGQGLGKIQLAEHFRKRKQQMSESVRHEAPIVRRVSVHGVHRWNGQDQRSSGLEHAMVLVYDRLGFSRRSSTCVQSTRS
jgi:hypothetical protein